jgi:hypothetical protein
MALLECLSTIANGPKDVGEATVLCKVVRRVTMHDLFDSRIVRGIIVLRRR